ncbi:signal peptidase I, partial [Enterococcus sp. S181_ASV_20]|nr:signal peptidase I [Enterococcus sp. S181_ASV_20]
TEEGVIINGNLQVETQIYDETLPYVKGIDYPVKIGTGQVFVLGDKRTVAVDSRVYGPIDVNDSLGKVITILRRRNI